VDATRKVERTSTESVEDKDRAVAPGSVYEGKESGFFMTASTTSVKLSVASLTFTGDEQWRSPKKEVAMTSSPKKETAKKPATESQKGSTPLETRKERRARKAAGETNSITIPTPQ